MPVPHAIKFLDAYVNRTGRVEDARRHDRAVLGESVRQVSDLTLGCGRNL